MGLDGGTKMTRSDVLRGSSWRLASADGSRSTRGGAVSTSSLVQHEQADPQLVRESRLNHCRISNLPLQPPVVADFVGNLYNKAVYLEFLLSVRHGKNDSAEARCRYHNVMVVSRDELQHLRSQNDVFGIQLETPSAGALRQSPQQAHSAPTADNGADAGELASRSCPVSHQPLLTNKVVALVPCGHIMCSSVVEMITNGKHSKSGAAGGGTKADLAAPSCPLCGKAFDARLDVIELAPDAKQAEQLRIQLANRKRSHKKAKRGRETTEPEGQSKALKLSKAQAK